MQSEEVQFVHFNDVYHVPSPSLLTSFLGLQRQFAASNPNVQTLTLFSGDAFSPSLEASVLKGEQICPILDLIDIDVACYGNHDFDFGDARLIELCGGLTFPWVLSNAYHLPLEKVNGEGKAEGKRFLGTAQEYLVKQLENGLRIGFLGLAGTDWPSNCEDLPPCEIESPVQAACRLARHLRAHERCDVVIALTHMRVPEDTAVANATASGDCRIDLLLGGHDHEVLRRFAGDTDLNPEHIEQGRHIKDVEENGMVPDVEGNIRIVKSGTDWRALSLIRLVIHRDEGGAVLGSTVKLRQYTDIKAAVMVPDSVPAHLVQMIESIHDRVGTLVQKPLLHSAIPLDGRNFTLRRQETNMGNLLADAIRAFYDVEIGFFNSGAIRIDQVLGATILDGKPLLVRDMINICPFGNALLVKRLTGEIIRLALENSVSDMHTDGRFLQISGMKMVACWKRPEGSRVIDVLVERPNGKHEPLDPAQTYTVAMPSFIAHGYDGFTWFATAEALINDEVAMTDSNLLLTMFGKDEETSHGAHAMSIERARAVIVVGRNPEDSLPIVKPVVVDRIGFVNT
ncbi:Metallo-dependent phosphatase-like protein [Aspergillus pseudoustus]|uniref:Metallo-dependent phosphatase-like protein n=1 Tax=Aspergillus pseudoustus TaxID=1810923 RepID=A0ABR4KJL3_9EURO